MTTHFRERHILQTVRSLVRSSPCVGLVGMRQVGKTTLFKQLNESFYSFDSETEIARFERESNQILHTGPFPVLLDEVQKYPKIFGEIKAIVDKRKGPGQFLLTGSIRFTLKKDIRESLTGRIVTLELLPFGLAEAHHKPQSSWLNILTDTSKKFEALVEPLRKRAWATEKDCNRFLSTGGLPGICFHRDEKFRSDQFDSQLDTLIGRDLHSIYRSKLSTQQCLETLRYLSLDQGNPLNRSELARKIGTTQPTLTILLGAFEKLFLIRSLGKGFYIEDQGIASHLSRFDTINPLAQLRRLVWTQLQQSYHYENRGSIKIESHTSQSGAQIPFILKHKNKTELAIFIDPSDRVSNSNLKIATWYQKRSPRARALFLTQSSSPQVISPTSLAIPYTWIF